MTEQFKEYIRELAWFCRSQILHGEYRLNFTWSKKPHDGDSGEAFTWASVRHAILHETCHLLTEPIAALARADMAPSQEDPYRQIIERQTERVTNAVMLGFPPNWYMPGPLLRQARKRK